MPGGAFGGHKKSVFGLLHARKGLFGAPSVSLEPPTCPQGPSCQKVRLLAPEAAGGDFGGGVDSKSEQN